MRVKVFFVFLFFAWSLGLSFFFFRRFQEIRQAKLASPGKFKILTTLRPRKIDGEEAENALAYGRATTIDPDGKIIAAGAVCAGTTQKKCDFAIVRFHPDGRLDLSFSQAGKAVIDFGADTTGVEDGAYALAIQPDGKILVAGQSTQLKKPLFAVARLDKDGNLDKFFGDGGKVLTDVSNPSDAESGGGAHGLALQSDGKILAAGGEHDITLVRYNKDGSRDTFFGETGRVTSRFGTDDAANAIAVQDDGKIVVGGSSRTGKVYSFIVSRYNVDGSLDTGFAGTGFLMVDNDSRGGWEDGQGTAIALQRDGKMVLLGDYRNGKDNDFILYRFNRDGSQDQSFGSQGKVVTDVSFGQLEHGGRASAIVVTPNDKLLVLGNIASKEGQTKFVLVRHLGDGQLDSSFGNEGKSVLNFDSNAEARAVAIQSDGKIIVVGDADTDPQDRVLALARYRVGGTLDSLPQP